MTKYAQSNGQPNYKTYLTTCIGFAECDGEPTQESAKSCLDALGFIKPDGTLLLRENKQEKGKNIEDKL